MEENIEILEGFIGRLNQDVYFDETTSFEYLKQPLENVLNELETYKKIAEKLADYIMDIYESRMNLEIITGLGGELTFKDVIDWARKEVENGNNN